MKYAKTTTVPVIKTRQEIEVILHKYGATAFASMSNWKSGTSVFAFEYEKFRYQIEVKQPILDDSRYTETGLLRDTESSEKFHQGAIRQRWRAVLLYVTAVLEAVDSGFIDLQTAPQVEFAIQQGIQPPMLPSGTGHIQIRENS